MNTQNNTTETVRIDADVVELIRKVIPHTGQTISGYIKTVLLPKVNKDFEKYNGKRNS